MNIIKEGEDFFPSQKMVFIAQTIHSFTVFTLEHSENCNFYYPLKLQPDKDAKKEKLWT